MKKTILYIVFLLFSISVSGQNNLGTPYSIFGIGLVPENYGPYAAMGGVSAAMRDNNNINFLNPASYTAMDSNRFYFQFGVTGAYVDISTNKEHSSYQIGQNAALNMGFRLFKNVYTTFGLKERSDIGYDMVYVNDIIGGSNNSYYNQHIQGQGGLNDAYIGLAYQFKNLSIGVNTSYVFGKIEKQQTLAAMIANSYYIKSSSKVSVSDVIFDIGLQYQMKLSQSSKLTLGTTFNLGSGLNAKRTFTAYKINTGSGASESLDDEELRKGNLSYPFKINSGFNYDYKDKWNLAGDYTFQKFSAYKEFGEDQKFHDYHKGALGVSLLPARFGRYWWQRNKYMIGTYFNRSHIELNNMSVNTYGFTLGAQLPFYIRNGELTLGIAADLGIRGTKQNGLIQEKYAKLRINIGFKEGWFMKRKID